MNLLEYYKSLGEDVLITKNEETGTKYGLHTVSYMHGGVDFNNRYLRMARGLTLDEEGNIILRGFDKFFNYKQLDDREDYSKGFKEKYTNVQPDKNGLLEVEEKLDGTMILVGVYDKEFIASTTSVSSSAYTSNAEGYIRCKENSMELKKYLRDNNKTLVFEFVSPRNQIVVPYKKEDYVLLGVVDNKTGEEFTTDELREFSKEYGFSMYKTYKMTLEELIKYQKSDEEIEGFIVKNKYGKRVKFKLDSWFELSKLYSIFYGKDITKNKIEGILRAYLNDDIDDLLAFQNQHISLREDKKITKVMDKVDRYLTESKKVYKRFENGTISKADIAKLEGRVSMMVFSKINRGKYITENMIVRLREELNREFKEEESRV